MNHVMLNFYFSKAGKKENGKKQHVLNYFSRCHLLTTLAP